MITAKLTHPALALLFEEGAEKKGGGLKDLLIPMVLVVGIFWVVLIMPERKKQKARDAMLAQMKKGDRVMTTSGMHATVVQVQDDVVTLQVANDVRIKFSRAAIQTVLGDEKKEGKKSDGAKDSATPA